MPLLRVARLTRRFGGIRAVDDCSFDVEAGTAVGLIGPNGSGKTTIFNLIGGALRPDAGQVFFDGARIDGLPPWEIARRGIGRTFQSIRLFRDLPVWENLAIAAMGRKQEGWESDGRDWLERLGLLDLEEAPAGTLSVGQQRLLELAMTLLVAPAFVMLDEPLAGVHPVIRRQIAEVIRTMRSAGRTFLVIEHHMPFVMELCDAIVVLDHGEKIAEGPPEAIRRDERVIAALLGQRRDETPA
ncbi:MAG TPA: ABC transporter ATP-binding protein [Candidatus Methylomirabilis sp.]|nr:ABC transporter ATP-binding protein [Candidatus Methylomirabilis sp.]